MVSANMNTTIEEPLQVIYDEEEINSVLDRIIQFGRYKNSSKSMREILEEDPTYFIWIANKMVQDGLGETKTCKIYGHVIQNQIPLDRSDEGMKYGRYKGKTLSWLLTNKTSYFAWLLKMRKDSNRYSNETRLMEFLMKKH